MLDKLIDAEILSIQTPFLNKLMFLFTTIGNKITLGIFSLALVLFLIYKKEYVKNKAFVIAMAVGGITTELLKNIIKRPRPLTMTIHETGYSFPSGHSTMSMIFFGMLIYLFKDKIENKTKKTIFIISNSLLILLIGFSRLYFNVHYPTDVLGGFTLGLLSIIIAIIATEKIPFLKRKKLFW